LTHLARSCANKELLFVQLQEIAPSETTHVDLDVVLGLSAHCVVLGVFYGLELVVVLRTDIVGVLELLHAVYRAV